MLSKAGEYFERHSVDLNNALCWVDGHKFKVINGEWKLVAEEQEEEVSNDCENS